MVSSSGVFCALKDMGVLDCTMYAAGLSGSAWSVLLDVFFFIADGRIGKIIFILVRNSQR